jgi:hypothetical protein
MKNGTRQVVVLGESNENNVVIEQGLQPGVQIYLSTPEKPENFKLVGEELISVIKDREKAKKAEELRIRQEVEKAKAEAGPMMGGEGMPNLTPEMMQRFQNMRGNRPGGPQGVVRDTSSRQRMTRQNGQEGPGQIRTTSVEATVKK